MLFKNKISSLVNENIYDESENIKEGDIEETKDVKEEADKSLQGNIVDDIGMYIEDRIIAGKGNITDDELKTVDQYINYIVENTINKFTVLSPDTLNLYDKGAISSEDVEKIVKSYMSSTWDKAKFGKVSSEDVNRMYEIFSKFIWGYDVIEPLLADEDISDINILSYDNIRIKKKGRRSGCDIKFRTNDSYLRFIEHVAVRNKKSLSEIDSLQNFVDQNSNNMFRLRFNISTDTVTSVGHPYISVRKIPKFKYGFSRLVDEGMLTNAMVRYIKRRVVDGHGIIISGKGGAGKTILMNEVLDSIPHNVRVDVIQDNEELFSEKHPDMMFHRTVEPQGEGKVIYDLPELGRNCLLEDLDAIVVGEIKGKEAKHLAYMSYTGHQSFCTTHSKGAKDAYYKIADYATDGTEEMLKIYLPKLVSLDTSIYLKDFKVVEVVELESVNQMNGTMEFRNINPITGEEFKKVNTIL